MRCAASSTFPFSSLQGTITDTESSSLGTVGGSDRATTTCVIQSLLSAVSRRRIDLRTPEKRHILWQDHNAVHLQRFEPGKLHQISNIEHWIWSQFLLRLLGTSRSSPYRRKVTQRFPRDDCKSPPTIVYAAGKQCPQGCVAPEAHPLLSPIFVKKGVDRIFAPASTPLRLLLHQESSCQKFETTLFAVARSPTISGGNVDCLCLPFGLTAAKRLPVPQRTDSTFF